MGASRDEASGASHCPECSAVAPEPVLADPDGYCPSCGRKVMVNRDHVERDLGQVVGVSDRGLRHHRNEDAMALAVAPSDRGPVAVAIVSDGVSSAPRPDEASLTAVRAAKKLLAESARAGEDPAEASLVAVRAASQALNELADENGAPAATYVSAVVSSDLITVCWLGDSRAYWLAADPASPVYPNADPADTIDISAGSRRVTRDDSLAEEIVAAGLASMEEAMASPQAHVITRWLGADLPVPEPHVSQFTPTGEGALLVCSDGLWNYRPEATDLAAMALPTALTRPIDAAADLVKFAIDSGGLDNITVVVIPFPPAAEPAAD